MQIEVLLVVVLYVVAAIFYLLWRKQMTLTKELTAAVDAAVAKIDDLQKSSTPDAEVQPQIDRLNNAVNPPPPPAQ